MVSNGCLRLEGVGQVNSLEKSPLKNLTISKETIVNVGMSIRGEVYKIVEIDDLFQGKLYALLRKDTVEVLSIHRRYIDILFVEMTGMSIE